MPKNSNVSAIHKDPRSLSSLGPGELGGNGDHVILGDLPSTLTEDLIPPQNAQNLLGFPHPRPLGDLSPESLGAPWGTLD